MPPIPDDEDDGDGAAVRYVPETGDEHIVAMWANVPITQVGDMGIEDYLRFRRDAFVFDLNQTEQGRAKLERAWALSQDKPDREAARALFGR